MSSKKTIIMPDISNIELKNDSNKFDTFIRDYWKYYLMLEEEFMDTFKYVEFSKDNYKTFSVEYLKLFQVVCSEIDVVGKAMAGEIYGLVHKKFVARDANIHKWWFALQNNYQIFEDGDTELLKDKSVKINEMYELKPWRGYVVEQCRTSNKNADGETTREYIRLKQNSNGKLVSKTPSWWIAYNDVKHQRTTLIKGDSKTNFSKANLWNLCNAFSALYILEWSYISTIGNSVQITGLDYSELFEGKPKSARFGSF